MFVGTYYVSLTNGESPLRVYGDMKQSASRMQDKYREVFIEGSWMVINAITGQNLGPTNRNQI